MRIAIVVAALAACSSPSKHAGDAAIGSGADALTVDALTADAHVDAPAPDAVPDALPATCAAGKLCLNVHPVVAGATIPNGRLVVLFYQLSDAITPYPPLQTKLDMPFDGTATSIEIDLAQIVPPTPIDPYYACPRLCPDVSNTLCACPANDAKLAVAMVMVMQDVDQSGAIEQAELVEENRYGVGYMQLGSSDADYPVPNGLSMLAPDGILGGLHIYRLIPNGQWHRLGIPQPGTVFDLDVCVPGDASCSMLRMPNLS